jgi:hypothetical protein
LKIKKSNAIVLLIIAIIIIAIGAGLYWGTKAGKIKLFAAFAGWSDVTPSDPAYTEMMGVGEKGWMNGYEDGTFRPDQATDRASITVGEVRARGDQLIDTSQTCNPFSIATMPFIDVQCNHWAIDYIATAKQAGIINGYEDGTFRPDAIATRAEGVVFIMKALDFVPPYQTQTCDINDSSTWPFPDVPCNHWAYDYIAAAKEANIIFGYASGNFEPEQDLSRRDLAVLLYRGWYEPVIETTISGKVTDAATKNAIPGAIVEIADVNIAGSILSAQTDSTGAYGLSVAITNNMQAVPVRASATGYQSETLTADLSSGNITLNFELSKVSAAESTVTGTVRDIDSGKSIVGAQVTVLGYEQGSRLSDRTDTQGAYTLKIGSTSGTFSVRASATNYHSKTSSVQVTGGTSILNFRLDRIEVPQPPGEVPKTGGRISAATTGAVLPITIVLIGTILALFSLIYLLRSGKPA